MFSHQRGRLLRPLLLLRYCVCDCVFCACLCDELWIQTAVPTPQPTPATVESAVVARAGPDNGGAITTVSHAAFSPPPPAVVLGSFPPNWRVQIRVNSSNLRNAIAHEWHVHDVTLGSPVLLNTSNVIAPVTLDATGPDDKNRSYVIRSGGTFRFSLVLVTGVSFVATTARVTFIVNRPPVAALVAALTSGNSPLVVRLDASATTDPDPQDRVVEFVWFPLGNGTAAAANTSSSLFTFTYTASGSFRPMVTAVDARGGRHSAVLASPIVVNTSPVAVALANVSSGLAPLTVRLNGTTSFDLDGTVAGASWRVEGGASALILSGALATAVLASPGTYTATLTVLDNAGAPGVASVAVFVVAAPPPAQAAALPELLSVDFDAALSAVLLTFREATNRAGVALGAATNCSEVLAQESIVLLLGSVGSASSGCRWPSSAVLRVALRAGTTVRVGSVVTTRSNVLLSDDLSSPAAPALSATVRAPANAPVVVARLAASASVGACSGVRVSAAASSGGAGRPLRLTYSLARTFGVASLSPTQFAALDSALAAASAAALGVVELESALLPAGNNFTFVLTATNWLDGQDTAEVTVNKLGQPAPALVIDGAAVVETARRSAVKLSAQASLASCAANDTAAPPVLAFTWSLVTNPTAVPAALLALLRPGEALYGGVLAALPLRSRQATLLPNSLPAGAVLALQAQVDASVAGVASGSAVAFVLVRVLLAPPVARLASEAALVSRNPAVNPLLVVDATRSFDPDDEAAGPQVLNFTWSCVRVNSSAVSFRVLPAASACAWL